MTPELRTFHSGETDIQAQVFNPADRPNGGIIIVAYGSDGMKKPWDDMINGYADSLTQKGFIAIVPNYLAVTKTDPGPGVFPLIEKLRPDWQEAISATIDDAQTFAHVNPKRVGLLGFSLGGHLCLRLRGRAKILVEYFAPVFDGIGAPGTLAQAQIHHGKEDNLPATRFSNAKVIEGILNSEGTPTELFGYDDAGHGFIGPALGGSDLGNAKARTESKTSTIAFFETHL